MAFDSAWDAVVSRSRRGERRAVRASVLGTREVGAGAMG